MYQPTYDNAGNESWLVRFLRWYVDVQRAAKEAAAQHQVGNRSPFSRYSSIGMLFAAPGYSESYDRSYARGNGISAGTVWSLFATINQKANATGQGLINLKLHATTKANLRNLSAVGFIDIVHGNNADPPVPGYPAHKGFDLASGWGAIDINRFVNSFIAFTPPRAKP